MLQHIYILYVCKPPSTMRCCLGYMCNDVSWSYMYTVYTQTGVTLAVPNRDGPPSSRKSQKGNPTKCEHPKKVQRKKNSSSKLIVFSGVFMFSIFFQCFQSAFPSPPSRPRDVRSSPWSAPPVRVPAPNSPSSERLEPLMFSPIWPKEGWMKLAK